MLTEICRTQLSNAGNDFPFNDPATESYDCNVAMCSEAVELVTGNKLDAATCRKIGKEVGAHGTGNRMARLVFQSQGMVAGSDYIMFRDAPTSMIVELLKAKWFVALHMLYGRLGELEPDLICDTYQDAHTVGIFDLWRSGVRKVHMADPLADGRYSGHLRRKVHLGVQTWPWPSVREGAWAYSEEYAGGTGLVSGYAVKPR
jgi:hypothetical protein